MQQRTLDPLIIGSCWSGYPEFGRIAAERLPEKARRSDTDDMNGWPSMISVDPMTELSAP